MKLSKISMLLGATLLVNISNVNAGLFDDLKDKAKDKSKQKAAQEVVKKVKKSSQKSQKTRQKTSKKSTSGGTTSLAGGPGKNLISMTKCADFKPENIITGYVEDYTFQQGFTKEKRSGLVKRKTGKLTHGCILPSLQPQQMVYMEVDTQKYEAMGNSNDWTMQCIKSDNPGEGAVGESESKSEYPYKVNYLSGKDMLLYCGNSEGIEECGEGSNSSRSGQWDKKLDARGKTMLSVLAVKSTLAARGGEKLFCQYYNKKSRVSLFAFEYLRVRG